MSDQYARLLVSTKGAAPVSFDLSGRRPAVIGRSPDSDVSVAGDPHLSRRHAAVSLEGGRLKVERLPGSLNPVRSGGVDGDRFLLAPEDAFTIGETSFTFVLGSAVADETIVVPTTMNTEELYALGDGTESLRLVDLLELPAILRSRDRPGFFIHIAELLRKSTGAVWACAVTEEGQILGESAADATVGRYQPSRTLIGKAVDEAPQPTLYSWTKRQPVQATTMAGIDWAVCAAARIPHEPAVIFYAAGRNGSSPPRGTFQRDRARFTGLVADMVGRSLAMDRLLTWQGRLEHFFAGPVVKKILEAPDLHGLEPRLAQSTVLFFDLRGSAQRSEDNAESILPYIGELRRVMSAMSAIIQEEGGVVLQYLGDGILASWGVPFDDAQHVDRACRCAQRMAAALPRASAGWSCGIGIHTGPVVAGNIGSDQVFSYSVLGPAVNLTSRIEGITKLLGVPVLVSAEVAEKVSPKIAVAVRLGCYQPAGLTAAVNLYELTAAPGEPARGELLSRGLLAFENGDWGLAGSCFSALPPEDRPAAYLRALAEQYALNPPNEWSGVIALTQK